MVNAMSYLLRKTPYLFALILSLLTPSISQADNVQFIAIGDMPYSQEEEVAFNGRIKDAIQSSGTPFVIHYGDIKAGKDACTIELLKQRRDEIYSLLPRKVIYTPGDNEWTDCDRDKLKPPVSELYMLEQVRKEFFSNPLSLPKQWQYRQQESFPENSRWVTNNIVFLTVHQVGTNNGRTQILLDNEAEAYAKIAEREQANKLWLAQAFELATEIHADGLVIANHADVTQVKKEGRLCTQDNPKKCDAFLPFRTQLAELAQNFDNKPVLLIHGDTNDYCMAQDMGAENIWRLNAWGDYQEPADVTLIQINTSNSASPFQVQTLIHGVSPETGC